jgi:hypothetical protein
MCNTSALIPKMGLQYILSLQAARRSTIKRLFYCLSEAPNVAGVVKRPNERMTLGQAIFFGLLLPHGL